MAAIFDETQMLSLARRKLTQNLPPDKQLANLDPQTFSYDLVSYDLAAKTAQIAVSVEGRAVINQGQGLIDPAELTALTAQQVSDKLTPLPQVESVEVKFTPTWLRKTPRIAEKIQIEISP